MGEAIGQSLNYALQFNKRTGILLILENPSDYKYYIRVNTIIKHFGLPIDVYTISPKNISKLNIEASACRVGDSSKAQTQETANATEYWISSTGKRHNSSSRHFKNCRGRLARNVGRATSFTAQSFNRSTNFAAVSQRMTRAGTSMVDRSVGEQLHHWFIPNNGWGKYVPNAIKNQPWNLNAIPKNSHQFIHGNSPIGYKYSALKSIYYQTPNWAKAVGIGGVLGGSIHLSNATSNYSSFGQSLYNLGASYITNTNSTSNLSSLGISFK